MLSCAKQKTNIELLCGSESGKRWIIFQHNKNESQKINLYSWVFKKDGRWFPYKKMNRKWEIDEFEELGDQVFDYKYLLFEKGEDVFIQVFGEEYKVIQLSETLLELKSANNYYKFKAAEK